MRHRIAVALAALGIAALTVAAVGQQFYLTTMQWSPYPATNGHAGFRLYFGTGPSGSGWTSTNVVSDPTATNFNFQCQPGVTYRSAISAWALDGRESPLSPEVTWTTPSLLPAVLGYRPAAIVYVP